MKEGASATLTLLIVELRDGVRERRPALLAELGVLLDLAGPDRRHLPYLARL
jgi:hypothetical protein